MNPYTWLHTLMALALPLLGWGQPIVFDTVHLNPVNSFLWGITVYEHQDGYLVFGFGGDGTGTVQDPRTFRFDSLGGLIQTKVFENSRLTDQGAFGSATRCVSGGYASAVNEFGNGISVNNLYLYRYDEEGDTLWTRYLMSDTTLAPRKCIETSSGDLVIVGLHAWPKGAYMFRLTSEGDSIAFVNFGEPSFFGMSVVEDAEQNLFIAGYTDTGISEYQFRGYILKCTPDGDVLWWDAYPARSGFNGLIHSLDGGVLAFGTDKTPLDYSNALLVKYSSAGEEQWVSNNIISADGTTRPCTFTNGFQQPDGSFIICGSLRNTSLGLADKGMLYKFDEQGNTIWSRFYSHYSGLPPGYPQLFKDVKQTSDGGFILAGVTEGIAPPNSQRLWLVKLDSVGCLVPGCNTVGVDEFESQLQSALHISPNPANERVTVALELPEGYRLDGAVQAILVDVQGKEVLRQPLSTNTMQLRGTLDVESLPAGLYYAHLRDASKWLAGGKVVVE